MKLQFRLRTLMIVVTLLAVPLGYVGWQAKIVRERATMREYIESVDDGECQLVADVPEFLRKRNPTVSWIRRLLGDEAIYLVVLPDKTDLDERRRIKAILPEAKLMFRRGVFVNGGESIAPFRDDQ